MDPNWAQIASAIAASIAALGVGGVIWQVADARRSHNAQSFVQMSRDWNEPALVEGRERVSAIGQGAALTKELKRLRKLGVRGRSRYNLLLRDPDFLEDLAVLERRGGIPLRILADSLGHIVVVRWQRWEDAVLWLRSEEGPTVYENFEALANRMSRLLARRAKRQYEYWVTTLGGA